MTILIALLLAAGAPTTPPLVIQNAGSPLGVATTINCSTGTTCAASGSTITLTTSGGSGTVTSVSATVPADESVTVSTATTTPAIAITRNTQAANTVLAGPTAPGGSSAAMTPRRLVSGDMVPNSDWGRAAGFWKTTSINGTTFAGTGISAPTASGTTANYWGLSTDHPGVSYTCSTANPSRCGVQSGGFTDTDITSGLRPKVVCRLKTPSSLTTTRIYCLLTSATMSLTDVVAGGSTGALSTIYFGVVYSAAQDSTHWLLCSGNGTTQGCTQGPSIAPSTWYLITADNGYTSSSTITSVINGTTSTRTTQIPINGQAGGIEADLEQVAAVAPVLSVGFAYAEWDN